MKMEPNVANNRQRNAKAPRDDMSIDVGSVDTKTLPTGGDNEQRRRVGRLSAREMESLTSLCDTFLPAIGPPDPDVDEPVARFYQTSAAVTGTPEHVAWLISERLKHHVLLVRFGLVVLSTRLGTLFMSGFLSLSPRFPFLLKFSELPLAKRQQILRSWAASWFFLFRMAFIGLKSLIVFAFFTLVDEKGENPSWKAIGYDGPDPDFKAKKQQLTNPNHKAQEQPKKVTEEDLYGPLYRGVISVPDQPKESIAKSLRQLGFHVSLGLDGTGNDKRRGKSKTPSMTLGCDAVVVGSGSGGGVVAGILARAGHKVLVLEKGGYRARTGLSLLEGPTLDQMYEGAGLHCTRDMGVVILAGSTVGGGSTVNWSASIRTPAHVRREWAHALGMELFESPLFEEALDRVCERMGVQRGEVTDEGFRNAVLRKGCSELGYPVEDVPRNAPPDHDCGWCDLGCKDGRKRGTSETWLRDMVGSGNGVVLSGCEAARVVVTRRREKSGGGGRRGVARGVEFAAGGTACVVEAKVVVVACGALNTPALLKRSGLKNPNIGKNLHVHPVVMAWGYFPDTEEPAGGFLPGKRSHEGAIITAMSAAEEPDGSGYGAIIQTPSLHPGLFSAATPWVSGSDFKRRMARFSRTCHIFALARDRGSGAVSSSPYDITYELHPSDEANLRRGVERVLRILAAAGAEEVGTQQLGGRSLDVKRASAKEFEAFVERESRRGIRPHATPIASAHQMGSCRMGVHPGSSVVDQRGEAWEVEGLYLADSSVFPTALGVNPMVTIQAIAYCTAQSVLDALSRKKK